MNNMKIGSTILYNTEKSFLGNHKFTFYFLANFVLLAILKQAYIFALFIVLVLLGIKNSKKYLPFSVLILSMMTFFNPLFSSLPSPLWNISIMIFATMFIIKKKLHFNKLEITYATILLSFLSISILVSPLPSIAIIKVISLSIFSYVVFKTYKWGNINELVLLRLIESVLIANIVLYFTSFGYFKNGLFMGIFNHSQSIGLFLVPLLSYYSISFLESHITDKVEKIYALFIIFLGVLEILATYSRTAIFTYFVLMTIYLVVNKMRLKKMFYILKNPFYFLIAISLLGMIVIKMPNILNSAQNYIYKSYSNERFQSQVEGGILSTRQALFNESIENFKNSPIIGNGFGVQFHNGELANNELRLLPLLDVPYTMVNEKGNVYLMVLEEGGLITFALFLLFIFLQLQKTIHYRPAFYTSIAILTMFNGEATFFSLNGVGGFQYVFLILLYFLAIAKVERI